MGIDAEIQIENSFSFSWSHPDSEHLIKNLLIVLLAGWMALLPTLFCFLLSRGICSIFWMRWEWVMECGNAYTQITPPSLASSVSLGKLLYLPMPQFLCLQTGSVVMLTSDVFFWELSILVCKNSWNCTSHILSTSCTVAVVITVCSSLKVSWKHRHYTQELVIYLNRQDRLLFECRGCCEGKEGQLLTHWGLLTGGCGRRVSREHLGNYPRAFGDPWASWGESSHHQNISTVRAGTYP